jgi:signal transduction histidine kinase
VASLVLLNVLGYAVKFTLEKRTINVTTARQAGGRCGVRVRDSGIGIPAGAMSGIFDAFEQGGVNVTRQYGVLGLWLAVCKALDELHQGSIRA